jgi:hypothetical protein
MKLLVIYIYILIKGKKSKDIPVTGRGGLRVGKC